MRRTVLPWRTASWAVSCTSSLACGRHCAASSCTVRTTTLHCEVARDHGQREPFRARLAAIPGAGTRPVAAPESDRVRPFRRTAHPGPAPAALRPADGLPGQSTTARAGRGPGTRTVRLAGTPGRRCDGPGLQGPAPALAA